MFHLSVTNAFFKRPRYKRRRVGLSKKFETIIKGVILEILIRIFKKNHSLFLK
jgi:hypothetical protein